jgi:hypothetical protein
MKHAGSDALDLLSPLLDEIRKRAGLKERKRGIFYRRSKAFVHFHEDPAGLFADLAGASDFARYPVNDAAERRHFLAALDAALRE